MLRLVGGLLEALQLRDVAADRLLLLSVVCRLLLV